MLRVHLLGRPRFVRNESSVSFAGRPKLVSLLAYLLLHRGSPLDRGHVAAALWPDHTDAEARANLRRHLNYLGPILPSDGEPWIAHSGTDLQWNEGNPYWLDVAEFEKACHEQPVDAVRLYAGDLLTAIDEEWAAEPRRELSLRYTSALLSLLAVHKARGDYARAEDYARMLLAYDPWREDALRQLLVLRFEMGDRAGALREYETFAQQLRGELDVEPMPETRATYEAIRSGVRPPGSSPERQSPLEIAPPAGGPVVGRERELQRAEELWARALAGTAQVLQLSGEAGIGKSRLAAEIAALCERRGGTVLTGNTGSNESVPYQAIAAALRNGATLAASSAGIEPLWIAGVAQIVPELRDFFGALPQPPALEPARERQRLFEAAAKYLAALAEGRPLCIVLEDLHWAGQATLDLCEYLVRRLRRSRIAFVLTYREEEVAAPLTALRRVLRDDSNVSAFPLARLSLSEAKRLLESLDARESDEERAAQLYHASEGNPFFLLQLAQSGFSTARTGDTITSAIAQRLDTLDESALAVAETASVAGAMFDLDLVTAALGWPERDVLEALGQLIDRRIVAERPPHGMYGFSHHLLAHALYNSVDERSRRRRHRRIAQVMEHQHGDRDELAHEIARHWHAGGEPARAAQRYLRAAAYAVRLYANEEANANAAKVVELSADERMRFEAHAIMYRVSALRGDRSEQSRLVEAMKTASSDLDDEARFRALQCAIDLANVLSDRAAEQAGIDDLQALAQRRGDSLWLAAALEAQAKLFRSTGAFDEEDACYEELRRLPHGAAGYGPLAGAYLAHADTLIYRGRTPEAHTILNEVLAALDPSTDRAAIVRTLIAFSRAALSAQNYPEMYDYAERALGVAVSAADLEGEAISLHTMANGLVYTFQAKKTREAYDRALELYKLLRHRIGQASILTDIGLFHTELGMLEEGLEYYARALSVAEEIGFYWVSAVANINAGYAHRLRGDLPASVECAERALAVAKERLASVTLESAALGTLGHARCELRQYGEAIVSLERAVELRRDGDPTPRLGDNLCALAKTFHRAGKRGKARETANELLEIHRANPRLAPQPAEWLRVIADVLRSDGGAARADEVLEEARAMLRERLAAIDDPPTAARYVALPFNQSLAS